jgi:hypothetical protein
MRSPIRAILDLKESIRQAGTYGAVPVPGSAELTLPAGEITIWYFEAECDWHDSFKRPKDLRVTVAPVGGGADLPVAVISRHRNTWSQGDRSLAMLGRFRVGVPGEYRVTAIATLKPNAVQPQVHLGP